MKQINNWNEADGSLNVKVYQNPFGKNGYYGRVTRRNIGLDVIIGTAAKKHPGISEGLMQIVAGYFQMQIMEFLGMGYSVNILELGTMYLATKGNIDTASPSAIQKIEVRFTPSSEVAEKVKNVNVETVVCVSTEPAVDFVKDTSDMESNGTSVTLNRLVRVSGSRLKVGGETSGVYFIPVMEDGTVNRDEKEWEEVPSLVTNKPKLLEFYPPVQLDKSKKYVLAVRTQLSSGKTIRKEALTGFSEKLEIKEAE